MAYSINRKPCDRVWFLTRACHDCRLSLQQDFHSRELITAVLAPSCFGALGVTSDVTSTFTSSLDIHWVAAGNSIQPREFLQGNTADAMYACQSGQLRSGYSRIGGPLEVHLPPLLLTRTLGPQSLSPSVFGGNFQCSELTHIHPSGAGVRRRALLLGSPQPPAKGSFAILISTEQKVHRASK